MVTQISRIINNSEDRRVLKSNLRLNAGWSVIRINETLQTYQPIKIIIKTLDDTKVKIRSITICDAGGELVAILPSKSYGRISSLSSLPVYKVHPDMLLREPLQMPMPFTGDNCKNGGVFTSAGCACPPGFMGTLCETGCGQNRFGQDCGGVCSFRTKRCRGLALCSPFFDCACAPGYTGSDCNEQCSTGTYGNSCSQKCGHCLSGKPCDIYTGSCDDCELGYLTPQCSEAYVYYSQEPALSYDDYRTLTVSFNPKNGTLGYGNPKLYQIQYKEVGGEWRTHVNKIVPIKYHGEVAVLEDEVTEVIENLKDGVMYEIRVLFMDANFNKYDGELVQTSKMVTKCDIPEDYDYNIQATTNTTSLTFSWTYNNMTDHWCPLEAYEVSWEEDWLWLTASTQDTDYTLTDFLPDTGVKFKVRAKTSGGFAPFSNIITATTRYNGSTAVRGLRLTASHSSSLQLSWQAPIENEHRKLRYIISYKCVIQLACPPGCKDAIEGQVTEEDTKTTLSLLLPFTQYVVTVTPEEGLPNKIYVGTTETVSRVSDRRSMKVIKSRLHLSSFMCSAMQRSRMVVSGGTVPKRKTGVPSSEQIQRPFRELFKGCTTKIIRTQTTDGDGNFSMSDGWKSVDVFVMRSLSIESLQTQREWELSTASRYPGYPFIALQNVPVEAVELEKTGVETQPCPQETWNVASAFGTDGAAAFLLEGVQMIGNRATDDVELAAAACKEACRKDTHWSRSSVDAMSGTGSERKMRSTGITSCKPIQNAPPEAQQATAEEVNFSRNGITKLMESSNGSGPHWSPKANLAQKFGPVNDPIYNLEEKHDVVQVKACLK
ncbi:hypothetical protein J6590_043927 [Homalodisca vitripennis]|nr:hypothetical protein J6590_043927 [Homalodisca vitripennis]